MKQKNIFCIAAITLVAAMIASCEKGPYSQKDKNEAGSYIQISVAFAGSEATKTAEDSGATVEGTVAENKIVTAYLYFFKDGNYSTTVSIGGGEFTPGTASASDGKVYYTSKPTEIPSGIYNVYATLNNKITGLTTETAFRATELSVASFPISVTESTGIAMSSRSTDGTLYQMVTVTSSNTFDNPVHIYLDIERSFAKLRYKANSNNGNTANVFTVYENRQTSGNPICNISLTKYNVINITKPYYLFRQVADLENNGGNITFTNKGYSALTTTNYIYDPVTTSRTFSSETLADVTSNVTKTLYTTTQALPTDDTGYTHLEYLTENSMHKEVQKQGYATALVFTGEITPATGNYHTTNGSGEVVTTTGYTTGDDLWFYNNKFYDSMETLNKDTNLAVENSNYAAFGVKYYKDGLCYYRYYIKHLDNGTNPGAADPAKDKADMGVMEYAIVRNNSYDVTVSNILAPGQSRLADDDYGYPNADDAKKDIEMDEVYFQVKLTIKPWIARTQSAVLG